MNTEIPLNELAGIEGGNPLALAGMAVGAYIGLLQKMESNPQDRVALI
jgi:hypothetical protein